MQRTHSRIIGIASAAALAGFGLSFASASAVSNQASPAIASLSQSEDRVAEGVIERVNLQRNEFTIRKHEPGSSQDASRVTFKVNDETTYTLDGMTSTRDEALKAGREAIVTHTEDTAKRVAVWSEPEPQPDPER